MTPDDLDVNTFPIGTRLSYPRVGGGVVSFTLKSVLADIPQLGLCYLAEFDDGWYSVTAEFVIQAAEYTAELEAES